MFDHQKSRIIYTISQSLRPNLLAVFVCLFVFWNPQVLFTWYSSTAVTEISWTIWRATGNVFTNIWRTLSTGTDSGASTTTSSRRETPGLHKHPPSRELQQWLFQKRKKPQCGREGNEYIVLKWNCKCKGAHKWINCRYCKWLCASLALLYFHSEYIEPESNQYVHMTLATKGQENEALLSPSISSVSTVEGRWRKGESDFFH